MMRHQLVQWILLPAGVTDAGRPRASVFVAPRLRPGGAATLADFPDFEDWRSVLDGLDLALERPDGAVEAPARVDVSASRGLWSALFPPTTTVRPFAFEDFADRPLVSFPVEEVLGYLRDRWAALAYEARDDLPVTHHNASPIGGPSTGPDGEPPYTLVDHFEELLAAARLGVFEGDAGGDALSERLRGLLDDAAAEARDLRLRHETLVQDLIRPFGSGDADPAAALYALAGFHARPSTEAPRTFPADRDEARDRWAETHDFHDDLAGLGDHPALLRRLGLVLDLELPTGFVPETADADPAGALRLRVRRPSAFPPRADDPDADTWTVDVTPWTWCRLTEVGGKMFFEPAERTDRGDLAHGFLHMDPDRYSLVTADVDGLGLKALNMAATLQRQEDQAQRPVEEPERDGVPTARTGGLSVVHAQHAEELHEDFYRARLNNDALEQDPDNPPDLAAEDLTRGYRVDIRTDEGWHSLHRRHVVYTPERDPAEQLTADDEGCVQLSLTAEADTPAAPADPDRPLYAHEALVTWDGWSLSAPRPGQPVAQEPEPPEAGPDVAGPRLTVTTDAPGGTLPRLRFRSRYQVRLRTVDLAGNAHDPSEADPLMDALEGTGDDQYVCSTPKDGLPYLRFEPVPPPELVPRFPYGPGEGLERLAIRSTPGRSAAEYAEASQSATAPSARFRAFCDRHVAAPKASLHLTETHGRLDGTIDAVHGPDPAAAAAAARSAYTYATRESRSFRDDPGAPEDPEEYLWIDADAVVLPYLPDPLCAGVKVRVTLRPGSPEETLDIPFDMTYADQEGEWRVPQPLRLRLAEGDLGAAYDGADELITIALPPGHTARLRLSSLFLDDPGVFALLGWCEEVLGDADLEDVREAIRAGTHWMTAPWRELTLVHAVQRPVESPQFVLTKADGGQATSLVRAAGATAADLRGFLRLHQASTARLDLNAAWDEVEDDGVTPYPDEDAMVRPTGTPVFSLPVPEPFGTQWLPEIEPLLGPFDSAHLPFSTRGEEHRTPEETRTALLAEAAAPGLDAAERRRLEAGAAQIETFRAHEFGDTKNRRVTYRCSAATRFREYFDPAMPAEDGILASDPVTVLVPSSAPPAKPDVLQVLPLMSYRQRRRPDGSVISERESVGLRVWLGRPWFSSGAEEKLAVVCHNGLLSPLVELSREITCLVRDPVHVSAVPELLEASDFENGDVVRDVPLYGSPLRRDIVAFRPVWDARRQAWYVDLEFPTGTAYFPFVRLGLARYQEHSLASCELSPLVPTAFVQTVPDRTLTCAVTGARADVTLSGPAPSASADAEGHLVAGSNLVAAVIETQAPALTDPYVGWTAAGPETLLACTPNGDGTAVWRGSVPLPPVPGTRHRLAVREYERHAADDRSASPSVRLTEARRLVHADVVPL
ncbi:hypothetical protein [Streptomyces sp. NPDC056144]|uniref:hypothetical protein n=1 Tax=unclassified Streptomyces TaxID=2593676 RepID=UPI0035D9E8BE